MGKYSDFAKGLDREFKAARDEYSAAYKAWQTAKDDLEKASAWRENDTKSAKDERIAYAQLAEKRAAANFDSVVARVWPNFYIQADKLRSDLVKQMQQDSLVNPAAVDNNALELLRTGVLSAADYVAFANKYADNATMLKLIAHYAEEAAKNTENKTEAGTLNTIAITCKDGKSAVLRTWDDLVTVAGKCSGKQYNADKSQARLVVSLADRWEDLSASMIPYF